MTDTLRWGLVGAGWISDQLAQAIARSPRSVVSAVAARDITRAQEFSHRFGIAHALPTYDELVAHPDVDVVYVGTTHPYHVEHALMAIDAGKPVLVEKPLALNLAGTQRILDAARERGVFAMEAMWTTTMPLVREIRRRVAAGEIGTVRSVTAALTMAFPYDESHRIYDMSNGGGALLDLGIYPVTFASNFVGEPTQLQVLGTTAPTGADDLVALQWSDASGAVAQCLTSSRTPGSPTAVIQGTEGWIEVEPPMTHPYRATIHVGEHHEVLEYEDLGYLAEVMEVEDCLAAGLTESPTVPHTATVNVMRILDEALRQLGVTYPNA